MDAVKLATMGVEEIDRQHAQLLECMAELEKHIGGTFDFAASMTAVTRLLDYTRDHFAYEEKLLEECGYPDLEKHKLEHRALADAVAALWRDIESGRELGDRVLITIRDWIQQHINAEDAEYARFLGH